MEAFVTNFKYRHDKVSLNKLIKQIEYKSCGDKPVLSKGRAKNKNVGTNQTQYGCSAKTHTTDHKKQKSGSISAISKSLSQTKPLFAQTGKKKDLIKSYKEKSFDYKKICFPRREKYIDIFYALK